MHTVRRSRVTLSGAYESCLACQHFISKLTSFVNLLTIFCFSMRMPIDSCSNIYLKSLKNYSHFTLREDKPSLSSLVSHSSHLPYSRHVFTPPRNFHATREEILSAGKPVRSKNNFRGTITMSIGPIWGLVL